MKKILLICSLLSVVACKDETTDQTPQAPNIEQRVYFEGNTTKEIYIQEYQENKLQNIKAKLVYPTEKNLFAELRTGDAQELADYNAQYGVNYKLLPTNKYTVDDIVVFGKGEKETSVSITLKEIIFEGDEVYALPLHILNRKSIKSIEGEEQIVLVIRPDLHSKVLKMGTEGVTTGQVFSSTTTFDKWTFEMIVRVDTFSATTAIIGLNRGSSAVNVGFVSQQLNLQVGTTTLRVPADTFGAEVAKWYALSFSYDGYTLRAYVNGREVATKELSGVKIPLNTLSIEGSQQLMREVRFWKRALSQQEIQSKMWRTLSEDKDLQVYLPLNGKKRDISSKAITNDENRLWNWTSYWESDIVLPTGAIFDNYRGGGYRFPPQ
nr:DUF1735 and LamG domain-containing protein [uncultured Capnocytophaga sp.]